MIFNTIDEYDDELRDIESRLQRMEERMKKYPERTGTKINYNSFKQLHDIISKDRDDYLRMMEENVAFHVKDKKDHNFSLSLMSEIFGGINNFTSNMGNLIENAKNLKFNHLLPVTRYSSGSLHLSFSMGDEKTDLREVQLNYELFTAMFDIFECTEEDMSKLKDKLDENCISSYKDLLNILIKYELDITLENSSRNVTLTHEDALRVYNLLSQ